MGYDSTRVFRKMLNKFWGILQVGYEKPPFRILSPAYRIRRRRLEKARMLSSFASFANSVLGSDEEVSEAAGLLSNLKLRSAYDYPKKIWDGYRIFAVIVEVGNKCSRVLDAGSGPHSNVLDWLQLYGFKNLYACDILLKREHRYGQINYYRQDITETKFPTSFFDFIVCQSVIEHGVDTSAFFKECNRLLKLGGILLISTDFWYQAVDTSDMNLYGRPWKILTPSDMKALLRQAQDNGFDLLKPINYDRPSRVRSVVVAADKQYTFLFFALRKSS